MKKTIAVVGGGDSSEYVISVQSAAQIRSVLDKDRYNSYVVSIRGDDWHVEDKDLGNPRIDRSDFSFTVNGKRISFDCAYITIHGTPGENGLLPAYFELLGIPHTTCGVLTSSLTFDKQVCKTYLQTYGIKMAKGIVFKKGQVVDEAMVVNELGLPVFVKPSHGGSSFGVSKVEKKEEIAVAVKKAFSEDNHDVLVEEFIDGREVTCGMVCTDDKKLVLPVTEIVSKNEFFDFEAKYQGASDEITPARISEEETETCQELTAYINDLLNCKGVTRTDFMLRDGEFYFIEINTIPGMSAASIVPQQAEAMGLTMTDIFTMVIEDVTK
ncbi:MAG: D-alanine--D-alanine ligase [Marinilabiliales bacterium]|nr:MAG: D-alanine--D-alanine ligase [Marinilabiliales bacterium]